MALPCSSLAVTHSLLSPVLSIIDRKCPIKKLKSSRTCLIGYSGFIHMNSLGADTHTCTYRLHGQKQFQETSIRWPSAETRHMVAFGWHTPGLKTTIATCIRTKQQCIRTYTYVCDIATISVI